MNKDWRVKAYVIWSAVGLIFGVVSAYFYTRAAQEYAERSGEPPRPGTGELLGLLLAAVAAIRQISELGRPDKGNK